jgi:hypothetical protein
MKVTQPGSVNLKSKEKEHDGNRTSHHPRSLEGAGSPLPAALRFFWNSPPGSEPDATGNRVFATTFLTCRPGGAPAPPRLKAPESRVYDKTPYPLPESDAVLAAQPVHSI